MSHIGVLAFRLEEERFDQAGQALDAAQPAQGEALQFVLVLYQGLRDLAFDVGPYLLVGIQTRRVRRQVKEIEPPLEALDVSLAEFGLANRGASDDQEDRLLGPYNQGHEEVAKHSDRAG